MDFNISQDDWKETPQSVKDYIAELHNSIQNLQAELNKYLQYSSAKDNPAESLCFNGLTDFLVTPYPLDISTEEFSFESRIFVNGNRSGPFKIIHIYGPEQLEHGTNWVVGPSKNVGWLSYQWGGIFFGLIDDKGVFHSIHSGDARSGDVNPPLSFMDGEESVSVNEWHRIAGTWDGELMKLHIDGEIVNSMDFDGNITLATQAYVGSHFGGMAHFFPGQLDDVRIWNKALSYDEIQLHNDGGMVEGDEHLVVNYSAKSQPVLVAESVREGWQILPETEDEIGKALEELPPAQVNLIRDLQEHLGNLEQRRNRI